MHKKTLFTRSIIYIMNGARAIKSIKNRLFEYRDCMSDMTRGRKAVRKTVYYVPIIGTPLTFGMQVKNDGCKADSIDSINHGRILLGQPQVYKYFFQFFVPDYLFENSETLSYYKHQQYGSYYDTESGVAQGIEYPVPGYAGNVSPSAYYPQPSSAAADHSDIVARLANFNISSSPTKQPSATTPLKKTTPFYVKKRTEEPRPSVMPNIIIGHVDNMVVNNNFQYQFPMYATPYPSYPYMPYTPVSYHPVALPEHAYAAKQHLSKFINTATAPTLDSNKTLLHTFLKQISPSSFRIDAPDFTLAKLWEFYTEGCERGIELFKGVVLGERPKMASYAPSLSGLCVTLLQSEKPVTIEYYETVPYHMRVPLSNKIQELAEKNPALNSAKPCDIDSKSWFAVLWVPINCTAQLQITGQFLIYYKLSKEKLCEQVAMMCHKLKECEFWKSIAGCEAISDEAQIKKFVAANPNADIFDYISIINHNNKM